MKLRSLPGAPEPRRFVCPWCADHFATRAELEEHWQAAPACRRNRGVSNPTHSKYDGMLPDGTPLTLQKPGAETLRRVREHETPKP